MSDIFENVTNYPALTEKEKLSLFRNVNIFRGFRLSEKDGLKRSFHDLYQWNDDYLPEDLQPMENTLKKDERSFSKVTHELKKMNIDSASLSLSSPFVSAESEFRHEQGSDLSTSEVNEYLLSQAIVRKSFFNIDFREAKVSDAFVQAVSQAVDTDEDVQTRSIKLLNVLNEWGYYLPQSFTLGGILYSEAVTKITDYSMAEKEKNEFSASFKTSFGKIGGGGGFSGGWSSEQTDTVSNKYENAVIHQIGGVAGLTNDYSLWATSLYDARFWTIIECAGLYPSLMLLSNISDQVYGVRLLGLCLRTLNSCLAVPAVYKLQPILNLGKYATAIEEMVSPY